MIAAGRATTATAGATAIAATVVPPAVILAIPTPPDVAAIVPAVVPTIPTLAAKAVLPTVVKVVNAEALFIPFISYQ
jgi:hypothetical protein